MNDATDRRQFLALGAAAALTAHASLGAATASESGVRTVCVLGATGRVGNLIVQQVLAANFRVVAVSRSADKLSRIAATYAATKRIEILQGDIGSDLQATDLRQRLLAAFGPPYAVVASLSSPAIDGPMRVLDSSTETLRKAFDANFFTHVTAARAFIPTLTSQGTYVGINGGLANFPGAGMAQLTTTQSALHALYQVLALEAQDPKRSTAQRPNVRALELFGLVDDGSTPATSLAMRIDGAAVGRRIAEILARPKDFPGPILSLKAKAFS
jgi:NAD(P)-dependent dehydrogenase (short-subunit alcohol dehydrogenase family)